MRSLSEGGDGPVPRRGVTPAGLLPAGLLCGLLGLCACGFLKSTPASVQLAASAQSLVPHADRDHFVYLWQRREDDRPVAAGIQVEHVTALSTAGEFEMIISEDGIASGRVRIRDDGTSIVLLSEDDLSRGVRLVYEPPLPYLTSPVMSGETRASVIGHVTALDSGESMGSLRITQVTRIAPAAPINSRLGNYPQPVSVQMSRTVQSGDVVVDVSFTTVLAPGIGEVRSETRAATMPVLQRELACAIIGGRSVGDCHNLVQMLQEIEHAGSTDRQ
jgi:hypothetical protein